MNACTSYVEIKIVICRIGHDIKVRVRSYQHQIWSARCRKLKTICCPHFVA